LPKIQVFKQAQLTGHEASVYTLAFDSSEKHFLSGGGEGWIVRWDMENPELGKLLARAQGNIYALCHLPEQELLIAGNMNGGMHWIDLQDQTKSRDIQHHQKGVFAIKVWKDKVLSLGGDGMLSQWSIKERRVVESLHLTNKSLRSIAIHPSRNELAIGASDHQIYILDADNWEIKKTIEKAHENSVFSLQYDPKGDYLWTGGRDAHLKTWEVAKDYQLVADQSAHWFTINDIAFHPKGHLLATASRDKTIKIWDAQTFKLLKVLETIRDGGHINSVNALYWSSYNNYLISCSDDRSLIIWKIEIEI